MHPMELKVVRVSAALMALWLSACGGGGGGDDTTVATAPPPSAGAPTAAPTPAPTVAPTPAPAAALAWTPVAALAANTWHWVASNPAGTVLAAAAIPGAVFLSRDSGTSWNNSGLPDANWISVDMDATGQTLVAVGNSGGMYRSTNGGTTWTRIDTAFNAAGNLDYQSVNVSQDGRRIVAAVGNGGPLYVSQDGGANFTTAGGSAAGTHAWRAVDGSADGSVVVAVTQAGATPGEVHVSTDGGLTFSLRAVPLGGAANPGGWYRVAMSDDGNTIAVAGNTDFAGTSTGLFVSHDRGATWTQGNAAAGTYTSIDMSANGAVIVATMSGATGRVLLSTNGGTSFAPLVAPAGETNWRAVATNAAGTRLVLAAGTFFGATGRVYLSSGTVAAP